MDRIHIDLTLARGDVQLALTLGVGAETFAIVGPSGAGKSSLLRAIAGLERPDSGRIVIGDHVVFDSARGIDVAPADRGVGMVFQDLALFPHMSVGQNVAYGEATPPPCSSDSQSATWPTSVPAGCRAASVSAWRWHGHSHGSRRSCCSTSPLQRSMRERAQ